MNNVQHPKMPNKKELLRFEIQTKNRLGAGLLIAKLDKKLKASGWPDALRNKYLHPMIDELAAQQLQGGC